MKWIFRGDLLLVLIIFVSGCAQPQIIKLPPVDEGWHKTSAIKSAYTIQKDDTIYSIAWAFGIDYRQLATFNNLKPPYLLHNGQRLQIAPFAVLIKNQKNLIVSSERNDLMVPHLQGWVWPTSGRVVIEFNHKICGNKGIDISGVYGQVILASNNGKVVYSGSGIRSYGKLIIIKHNDDYLSAYAYNQMILVVEGQTVTAGQKIATMGYNDEGYPRLHFEIRRFGKPINPGLCLPPKP